MNVSIGQIVQGGNESLRPRDTTSKAEASAGQTVHFVVPLLGGWVDDIYLGFDHEEGV
jgi:hypothetical protein